MSVEIIQNIFDPGSGAEAALSHSCQQGLDQFIPANRPTFDHARHHLQIRQHGRIRHARFVQEHPFQKQPSSAWWCCHGVVRAGSRWHWGGHDATWLIQCTAAGVQRCGSIRKIDRLPAMGRRGASWLIGFTVAGIRRCGIIRWGKIGKTGELAATMGRLLTTAALAVASFFVPSSLGRLIVLGTTSVRALPSMLFPAAERAV
jgi:hypothetical protein